MRRKTCRSRQQEDAPFLQVMQAPVHLPQLGTAHIGDELSTLPSSLQHLAAIMMRWVERTSLLLYAILASNLHGRDFNGKSEPPLVLVR
jgi:hypothetical protein